MLIRNAAIADDRRVDIRITGDTITEVSDRLEPSTGEVCIEAGGHALIPGLHDHHMHLLALAAARQSLDCRQLAAQDREALAKELNARRRNRPDEIRVIGYYPDHNDTIDRTWLDSVCPDIPVRVQHQSGRLWILNSAAIGQIAACANSFPHGAERNDQGELTGRFFHLDDWLREQLPRHLPDIGSTSRQLAAYGVTGITDAGPDNDDHLARLLIQAQQRGELLQRVTLMGQATLSPQTTPQLVRGAHKLYLKETALPEFDTLCADIRHSHSNDRPVAFHCVTRVELQFALTALQEAGTHTGDRIEHASIADDDALKQLKQLGVTVVTQPHFISERGDRYRQQVDADDQPWLYRGRSFLKAGIPLAAGTDAPFGHCDPWRSMRAAVQRRTPSGVLIADNERLTPLQALQLYLGPADHPGGSSRCIEPGAPADLCLLDAPWSTILDDLSGEHVQRVWCAGETLYDRHGGSQ